MKRKTKAERERRLLEQVAYHEAGHAVACVRLGRAFRYATIVPKEDSLGHVLYTSFGASFRPGIDVSSKTERIIDRQVLIALAGMAADRRFVGRRNWRGARSDLDHATEFGSFLHGDDEVLSKYVEYKLAQADSMMRAPIVWVQVEAVAAALLDRQHLAAVEIRRICLAAIADGARLAHWERLRFAEIDAEQARINRDLGLD